jgi:hypothetical protein
VESPSTGQSIVQPVRGCLSSVTLGGCEIGDAKAIEIVLSSEALMDAD